MENTKHAWMLETMVRIRRFEETVRELFADGEIPGFVHLYSGEEASAVGACAALEPDDYITSTHRGHGHCIAKGLDVKMMMAELYGKATGYCKGKGGSMHIADFDSGMLGANAIVGSSIPIAVGAALSSSVLQNGRAVVCFFGDGSMANGSWHEGMNLAAVWRLPVIFLCENNLYGELSSVDDQHRVEQLSDCAAAYGMAGVSVDGMDVLAVYDAVRQAVERAKRGEGPTFIESKTYRFRGHFEGDPETYRTKEEVEEWRKRDPIETFKNTLIQTQELTEEAFAELEERLQAEITAAVDFARSSPYPDAAEAYTDVFSEE